MGTTAWRPMSTTVHYQLHTYLALKYGKPDPERLRYERARLILHSLEGSWTHDDPRRLPAAGTPSNPIIVNTLPVFNLITSSPL